MRILIDTSVIIDFLRQKNKEKSDLYRLVFEKNQIYISIFTHTELYAGKSVWENKVAKEDLEKILSGLKIISFSSEQSLLAGEIRAKYNIDLVDAIIAATCIIEKLPLLTFNKKHFKNIKNLKLI